MNALCLHCFECPAALRSLTIRRTHDSNYSIVLRAQNVEYCNGRERGISAGIAYQHLDATSLHRDNAMVVKMHWKITTRDVCFNTLLCAHLWSMSKKSENRSSLHALLYLIENIPTFSKKSIRYDTMCGYIWSNLPWATKFSLFEKIYVWEYNAL